MTTYSELDSILDNIATQQRAADRLASKMARLLVGRLRQCNSSTLRVLKAELRDFNMTTGKWR